MRGQRHLKIMVKHTAGRSDVLVSSFLAECVAPFCKVNEVDNT